MPQEREHHPSKDYILGLLNEAVVKLETVQELLRAEVDRYAEERGEDEPSDQR